MWAELNDLLLTNIFEYAKGKLAIIVEKIGIHHLNQVKVNHTSDNSHQYQVP